MGQSRNESLGRLISRCPELGPREAFVEPREAFVEPREAFVEPRGAFVEGVGMW